MDFNPVSSDIIKFEMRGMGGDPAAVQEKRKKGGFWRFLSGIGRFLAAPLMAVGAVAPPLLIAGLGASALAATGDAGQSRTAAKEAQRAAPPPQQYFFPGVDTGAMAEASSALAPSTLPVPTALKQSVTDVIYARSDAREGVVNSFRQNREVANV